MRLGTFSKITAVALLVVLGAAAAIAAPSTVPNTAPQMVGVPSFVASYWTTPPYILANPCAPGESAITFRIIVRNSGTAANQAINDYHAIWAQDVANPAWGGGATLPVIKAGDGVGVYVPLVGLKDPDQMQGHHVFKVTFEEFGGNTLQIPVDFPAAFCKPVTSVAPYSVASAAPHVDNSKYAAMPQTIPNPNLKTVVFGADVLGTMVADVYVWTDKSVVDNDYYNKDGPFVRDLLYLEIGHTHNASLFRDQAHTQVSQYTNSIYRGYVHFPVTGIAGHTVTSAKLRLNGNPTYGTTCIAQYGVADHLWNPGDKLFIAGTAINGPFVGQDLSLDVTSIVQSWAKSSNPVTAFAFTDGVPFAIYNVVAISDSCITSFKQAVLDVTYL